MPNTSSAPSRTLDLRRYTTALLKLARTYRRAVNKRLEEHGISDARALPVLQVARAGGGMRQGALAEELGIEGPSLVRLLDQICAAGLIERREDPRDRRAKTLHPTDAGLVLAATLEEFLHDLRAQLMAGVSDEDLAAALRVFDALDASVEARLADGG
jgi:MarR family transcriptional regulator for hemolysin